MEAEAKYTYVGLAVLALLAALVAGVVWLKHTGSARNFVNYTIYFERQALDGLQIGGDVVVRGIKVGRVDDYALAGQKINRVRVTIRVDRRTPVLTNTVATISRNLVTGIAQVVLVNPEPVGPPLIDVPDSEPYPVIAEGSSDLQQIAGRVSEVGERAMEVMDNVNKLLSPQNRGNLDRTLANLAQVTASTNARMDTLDRTLLQVSASAAAVGKAAERIAGVAGTAGASASAALAQTASGLDATLSEARQALVDTRRAANEASRAAAALQTEVGAAARRLDATAASLDDQLTATLGDVRAGSESLNRTLDRLQDPRAALFGPSAGQLGPGERR